MGFIYLTPEDDNSTNPDIAVGTGGCVGVEVLVAVDLGVAVGMGVVLGAGLGAVHAV
jgi:hypothetical protein